MRVKNDRAYGQALKKSRYGQPVQQQPGHGPIMTLGFRKRIQTAEANDQASKWRRSPAQPGTSWRQPEAGQREDGKLVGSQGPHQKEKALQDAAAEPVPGKEAEKGAIAGTSRGDARAG